jgi:hypothetical protein
MITVQYQGKVNMGTHYVHDTTIHQRDFNSEYDYNEWLRDVRQFVDIIEISKKEKK